MTAPQYMIRARGEGKWLTADLVAWAPDLERAGKWFEDRARELADAAPVAVDLVEAYAPELYPLVTRRDFDVNGHPRVELNVRCSPEEARELIELLAEGAQETIAGAVELGGDQEAIAIGQALGLIAMQLQRARPHESGGRAGARRAEGGE